MMKKPKGNMFTAMIMLIFSIVLYFIFKSWMMLAVGVILSSFLMINEND